MVEPPMKLLDGIRAWWRRRFRGFVAAPKSAGGQGTSWQQHRSGDVGFTCACGRVLAFHSSDLVIRSREHVDDCPATLSHLHAAFPCGCPITAAPKVKISPECRLGHWKQAFQGITK